MNRGEIRWYTCRLPDKRRPVLIPARSEIADVLNEIIVVPATRTIRGLATEVILTPDVACPLPVRWISTTYRSRKDRIGAVPCTLPEARWTEVERAAECLRVRNRRR